MCRSIAKQTIHDIAREWTPNQMLGWHGVWLLYQASMIPLVSIFWESWNEPQVREWQRQIQLVLEAFEGMTVWSLAARRSKEVVSKMYEASKRPVTTPGSPRLGLMAYGTNAHGLNEVYDLHATRPASGHTLGVTEMGPRDGFAEPMLIADDQSVWDLDGMLWRSLPEGLDVPFDKMPILGYEDPEQTTYEEYMRHQG